MVNVKFTNKAKTDLEEIWEYTYETWSENQADKYYLEITESCQNLKYDFKLGKDYSNLLLDLKGMKINKHVIFYRILMSGEIEVERILHENMDIKKHLNE